MTEDDEKEIIIPQNPSTTEPKPSSPLACLKGHVEVVTDLLYRDHVLYSSSHDKTVRQWKKSVSSLNYLPALLMSGGGRIVLSPR